MKVMLDACVLYPTVMREVLLGVAAAGLFQPLWSDRILEEWARATIKLGAAAEAQARGEVALLRAAWPKAVVSYAPSLEARLWLPDPADTHVLAAAISGHADLIVTLNAKDFPQNILREEGLDRVDPDLFLLGLFEAQPVTVAAAAEAVRLEAERLSGGAWDIRRLMKKAHLPRFGKALAAANPSATPS
jgi:predicted nucleic acid-binding protein